MPDRPAITHVERRTVLAEVRETAARVFARSRRHIAAEVFFVRIRHARRGRPASVSVEPRDASLSEADAFEGLRRAGLPEEPDALRAAVRTCLDRADREQGMRSFSGSRMRVGRRELLPVVRFDRDVLDAQPALGVTPPGGGCRSLLEGIARTLLSEATRGLRGVEGVESDLEQLIRDPEDILRTAGRWMMITAGRAAGHPEGLIGLFDEVNEIASLRYEGRDPSGRMILGPLDHSLVKIVIRLEEPVPLGEPAWARKILEVSTTDLCVLSDSVQINAFGSIAGEYDGGGDFFVIDFTGYQRWELRHAGTTLMRVAYGIPALPEDPLDQDAFRTVLRTELGELEEDAVARIWAVVRAALDQRYGALVVVTDAAHEAARLSSQGTPIEPVLLSDETIERVTSIDGAVLIDTSGRCHAIGVILDGRVREGIGSPARGARYNSAVRYVDSAGEPAVAVVVSEDGTIDVVRRSALRRLELPRTADQHAR